MAFKNWGLQWHGCSILSVVGISNTGLAPHQILFLKRPSWPLAFVLGAVVSSPDAVAASGIIKGLGLNKKVITILEGESLVNDASAPQG
jgi:NhaP-type Na+/H+ or K+/H+ antiporter